MSVVANVAINVDSRGATQKLREIQGQAQQTERAFGSLTAVLGRLAIAAAAIQGARFVFAKTAELETQARSLQVLTGSAQKAAEIIQQLKQLGAVTPFTSAELIDSAKRLQAFGVEADAVVETTRRLADVSGATGAELQGLVTAYGQVQAKGRLQGEELLQFQERGVALQEELRKMYGLSGDEFQKALEKGRISAEAVEVAVQRLTDTGGKYANGAIAQSDTLAGKFSTLQDGIESIASAIGTALSPAIKVILNEAIFAINAINNLIATGARARGFGLGQQQRQQILRQAQSEAEQIINLRRVADPFERNRQFQELASQRERDLIESYGYQTGQIQPRISEAEANALTPQLLGQQVGGGSAGARRSAADDAAKEEARLQSRVRGIQLETAATKQLAFIRGKIAEAQIAGDQQLAIRLQGEEKNQQILVEYQKTLEGVTDQREQQALQEEALAKLQAAGIDTAAELERLERDRRKTIEDIYEGLISEEIAISAVTDAEKDALRLYEIENELKKQGIALTEADRDAIRRKIADIRQLAKEQQSANNRAAELNEIYEGIAGQIAGGVGNAIDAIANGVDNLGDALANIGKDIMAAVGKMLIFYALAQAFGALSGNDGVGVFSFLAKGFGFKGAKDGAYWPGGFQAFANGGVVTSPTMGLIGEGGEPEYVIPASKMRGAMQRYAGGARGASVIPGSGESSPAAAGGTATLVPIDVRYTVERINSVDYVTADQFQAGMQQAAAQGAQRGEQRALRSLQQSTAIRSRVGIK